MVRQTRVVPDPASNDDSVTSISSDRVARVLVALADTLVDDFDVLDYLRMLTERCVELLDVSAAGVVLSDRHGKLQVAAASSENAQLLELFAVQAHEGPCVECIRTGQPVVSHDLQADKNRWPRFTAAALVTGFHASHAVPMRLRRDVIGVLAMFKTEPNGVDPLSSDLAQALADVATIGILQERAISRGDLIAGQLQAALTSRISIEQAKGILAERGNLDMEQAFRALRGYARRNNRRLTELAVAVTDGSADINAILDRPAVREGE
ncbi:GAF and ANTAR domain-containing protein [Fodinicola feengrottensis]|uniref:GAF and ANTAR domain-containing protein n=2 Tax=Fodinicola feengrottensis TaxID=435914 RepID=A0ABP4SNL4_9ACTN